MTKEEKKEKIKKEIVSPNGGIRHFSAQRFAKLNKDDLDALTEVLTESGQDPDTYIEKTKALFPARYRPPTLDGRVVWRKR